MPEALYLTRAERLWLKAEAQKENARPPLGAGGTVVIKTEDGGCSVVKTEQEAAAVKAERCDAVPEVEPVFAGGVVRGGRGGRPKKIIPAAEGATTTHQPLCEYERAREERIKRNREVLASLNVAEAARALEGSRTVRRPPAAAARSKPKPPPTVQTRKSRRLARADRVAVATEDAAVFDDDDDDDARAQLEEERRQLTCDEWAAKIGVTPGPKMTGHFSGWVAPAVCAELGIAGSAGEAWEQNGGGKFDRKPPKGESAKEFARRMLKKNPNAYFYRHNVPGEDTWHGDWGQDEIDTFVELAKTHGCGDKWGLFASHIPHRVGYQCSAVYRHVIIPRGLLRDDNFRLTHSGEAVWCGGRGGRGGA